MRDVFGAARAFTDRTSNHVYSDRNSFRAASKFENCYVSDNALQVISSLDTTAGKLFANHKWSTESDYLVAEKLRAIKSREPQIYQNFM